MKNHARKFIAALLAFAMAVSMVPPAVYAAPAETGSDDSAASTDEASLSSASEISLEAARILASLKEIGEDAEDGKESTVKSVIKDAIFNFYNDTIDFSDYNISAEEM